GGRDPAGNAAAAARNGQQAEAKSDQVDAVPAGTAMEALRAAPSAAASPGKAAVAAAASGETALAPAVGKGAVRGVGKKRALEPPAGRGKGGEKQKAERSIIASPLKMGR